MYVNYINIVSTEEESGEVSIYNEVKNQSKAEDEDDNEENDYGNIRIYR